MHASHSRSTRWRLSVKRLVDLVASCALLVVATPLLVTAGIAIAVTSKGPIFHLGKRCGLGDTTFTCFKLRTMRIDQDALLTANSLTKFGDDDRLLIFDRDPRITKVGGMLRKLSIDELPQLLNVVRGDMSIIGPRALVVSMLENYPEIRTMRSAMRPGITGLWQVRDRRKNVSVFDMIDDDMEYIRTFSLGLDLKIALLTVPRIIERPIANAHDNHA
jgi:exopolysaccharide production protein ExoY